LQAQPFAELSLTIVRGERLVRQQIDEQIARADLVENALPPVVATCQMLIVPDFIIRKYLLKEWNKLLDE